MATHTATATTDPAGVTTVTCICGVQASAPDEEIAWNTHHFAHRGQTPVDGQAFAEQVEQTARDAVLTAGHGEAPSIRGDADYEQDRTFVADVLRSWVWTRDRTDEPATPGQVADMILSHLKDYR